MGHLVHTELSGRKADDHPHIGGRHAQQWADTHPSQVGVPKSRNIRKGPTGNDLNGEFWTEHSRGSHTITVRPVRPVRQGGSTGRARPSAVNPSIVRPSGLGLEGFTLLLYSPVGLDPKLAKRASKDSLK